MVATVGVDWNMHGKVQYIYGMYRHMWESIHGGGLWCALCAVEIKSVGIILEPQRQSLEKSHIIPLGFRHPKAMAMHDAYRITVTGIRSSFCSITSSYMVRSIYSTLPVVIFSTLKAHRQEQELPNVRTVQERSAIKPTTREHERKRDASP